MAAFGLHERILLDEDIPRLSPTALAFVGDAVFELHIRVSTLWPPRKVETQRREAVTMVRAEGQAVLLRRLMGLDKWVLSQQESELLRRGRNSAGRAPPRLSESSAGMYGEATALETLLGFLFLTDQSRLVKLLAHLDQIGSEGATEFDDRPPQWGEEPR